MKLTDLSQSDQRGSALVESAIALPVFVVILFGIIQWGYIVTAMANVSSAASVGVRAAALYCPERSRPNA